MIRGQHYRLLRVIMQGKINKKQGIRRQRIFWLCNFIKWFNCTSNQLLRVIAMNKIQIMAANLCSRMAQ